MNLEDLKSKGFLHKETIRRMGSTLPQEEDQK